MSEGKKQSRAQALATVVEASERRDVESMLELEPDTMDPSKTYRFVKDDPLVIARRRMQGYRPVLREEDAVRTVIDADDQADGLIRVADTILMACDKEKSQERRKKNRAFAEAKLKMPRERVKEMARKRRVRVHDESREG